MKNKKMVGFLVIIAVIIWGLIFYKIFNTIGAHDNANSNMTIEISRRDTSFHKADTFMIMNNYRDPFLGTRTANYKKENANAVKKNVIPAPKVATTVKWPVIVYNGIIKKKESVRPLALVKIDGKSEFMTKGYVVDEVELINLYKDSISVGFNGERKTIKK